MSFRILALVALLPLSTLAAEQPKDFSKEPGFAQKVQALANAALDRQQLALSKAETLRAANAALGLGGIRADRRDCDNDNGHQPPPNSSCINSVCQKLGTFGCDDRSEIEEVTQMCRGQRSGECIDQTCAKLGTFGCDDRSEIREVAEACRGNNGGRCVEIACAKLGTFGCDDRSEVLQVLNACNGVWNVSCIEDVCQRLGTFGCDDRGEILRVIDQCK